MSVEFIEPKIDWVASDYINYWDYNRIRNNLIYLNDKCNEYFPPERIVIVGAEKQLGDYAYAPEWNNIENIIETINDRAYRYDLGETKQFNQLGYTIDYEELNRIERAILRLKIMFDQIESQRKTAFRANGTDFVDSGEDGE